MASVNFLLLESAWPEFRLLMKGAVDRLGDRKIYIDAY
jgi:hypothetical protein